MAETKRAFWEEKNTAFIPGEPSMDLLHPGAREEVASPELTETQYLGFNVPEHDIHGFCYLWHHPNLGVVSGGVWAWRGVKAHNLDCELFDMLIYVDDAVLANDLHAVELPNGYRVSMVDPLRRLRVAYEDEARGNRLDLQFDAIMEPMVLAAGGHFEQAMHVTGDLRLAGVDYTVDGHSVRDRSWGAPRSEAHVSAPPMGWMTGVFGDDLAFGTTAFDSEDTDPEWKGKMALPGGDPLRGGWVMRDGELFPVVAVSKRTHRNAQTLFPEAVDLTITDASGVRMELRGTVKAAAPWQAWHNFESVICLVEWEYEGRIGYADLQEVRFKDYIRRFIGGRDGTVA